jgi:Fur family ferric uptake transcriptional regulator
MRLTANKIAGLLREHGHKLTPQRLTVIKVMTASEDHMTPDELYDKARRVNPAIGRVTVYRTLDVLNELGLLCRVHGRNGCRSYLVRKPVEHHHHLVCSSCGKVVDFTNCDLAEMEKKLSRESGFAIQGHLLEFYGVCRGCITSGQARPQS